VLIHKASAPALIAEQDSAGVTALIKGERGAPCMEEKISFGIRINHIITEEGRDGKTKT
jgi:hypothetical protein